MSALLVLRLFTLSIVIAFFHSSSTARAESDDDAAPLAQLRGLVASVEPGRWVRLPGSPLDVALTREEALRIAGGDRKALGRLWGWGGPPRALGVPGAMAFDGRYLYSFGGGKVYRGNDIVAYDLETLTWRRLYDPSPVGTGTFGGGRDFVPLRGPMAVPVHDGLLYSPTDDALYLFGSGGRSPWRFRLDIFRKTDDPWRSWEAFDWPADWKSRQYRTALLEDGRIAIAASGRNAYRTEFSPQTAAFAPLRSFNGGAPSSMVTRPSNERLYTTGGDGSIIMLANDSGDEDRVVGQLPPAFQGNPAQSGMALEPVRDLIVFWAGGRVIWSWDPDQDIWQQFNNFEGPAPAAENDQIFSAFHVIPGAGLFIAFAGAEEGLWAWKMPDAPEADNRKAVLAAEGYRCSDDVHGWACPDLGEQIAKGSVMKGIYVQCARIDRAVDFNDSLLRKKVCGGKAALIAKDGAELANVTIENISIGVNGACIRWEGGTVRLRNVVCRDSDMGLLGTGDHLVIEDSLFERTRNEGANHGHILYISRADHVEIRRSILRDPGNEGHALKSGARILMVEETEIVGGDRPYSRLIDAFNGGELFLRDVTLRTGSHGGNGDLIGYGAEMRVSFPVNRIQLEGGTLDCTARQARNAVHIWPGKASPATLDWNPEQNSGCPPPRK